MTCHAHSRDVDLVVSVHIIKRGRELVACLPTRWTVIPVARVQLWTRQGEGILQFFQVDAFADCSVPVSVSYTQHAPGPLRT